MSAAAANILYEKDDLVFFCKDAFARFASVLTLCCCRDDDESLRFRVRKRNPYNVQMF